MIDILAGVWSTLADIPTGVWTILVVIVSAGLTAWLGLRLREKFELRAIYLAPFKEWCSELYGELYEFNGRYLEGDDSRVSDLQVIVDYRELHEPLRYAPRWVGKIASENKHAAGNLSELIEVVDVFWHGLENIHSTELPSKKDVRLFEAHIKSLTKDDRKIIASRIRDHLKDERQSYCQADIEGILEYLKKKIP